MRSWSPSLTDWGGKTPDAVSAVDPRPLHVLQQPGDEHADAVGDRVDIDFDALEVTVDPDGAVGIDHGGGRQLAGEVVGRIAEVDGETADDERGPDDDRVADALGERERLLDAVGHAAVGLRDPESVEQGREPDPFLGLVDRLEVAPQQGHPAGGQRSGEVERRLATERDDRRQEVRAIGTWRFGIDDAADAFGVQRLEIEPRRGVEVGRDGLRVRVDHHRRPAVAAKRVGRLDGAIVELDALADADRTAADDEGRRPRHGRGLGRGPGRGVGRIEVRGLGRELRRARIHHRVPGDEAQGEPRGTEGVGGRAGQAGQFLVAEPGPLDGGQEFGGRSIRRVGKPRAHRGGLVLERHVAPHLAEEPGGDPGRLPDDRFRDAAAEQAEEPPQPRVRRLEEPPQDDGGGGALRVSGALAGLTRFVDPADRFVGLGVAAVDAGEVVEGGRPLGILGEWSDARLLQPAERLVQRRAEGPIDRHHLAGRLHLAAEAAVGSRELVEREARQLDDDVVEGGLERGDRRAGHDVRDLGQPPPHRDLRRDPGDRVARGLARERR